MAQNSEDRGRDDGGPKRQASHATDGKRDQDCAQDLQSACQSVPPARVTPSREVGLRPARPDRVEDAGAEEAGGEEPDCKRLRHLQATPMIRGTAARTMITAV